jgi:DNA ligase D-like protein (predicted 3'-phosphoesterase)
MPNINEKESETEDGEFEWPYGRPIYVIQKHQARSLHWDLRLEMEGVLKSWAVPKEPPTKPGVKRLAVMVDDHELEHATFEEEISEGEYGAGTVEIWDRGSYEILEQDNKKFIIDIHGEKLQGKYVLLHFAKGGEQNWLFFKMKN